MAKGIALCLLMCALPHIYEARAVKGDKLPPCSAASVVKNEQLLIKQKYAHLQAEIDEWKRLGKPTKAGFQHRDRDGAGGTVTGYLTELPKKTSLLGTDFEGNIDYYLYTRENQNGTKVSPNATALKEVGWNAGRRTKVLVHGFGNTINSDLFTYLVPALLKHGDYNLICVDWGNLAKMPFYIEARSNVDGVGQEVAKLVDNLVVNGGLNLSDLHLMGHSLGAHVVGNAGKHTTSGKISRITGMDPAMPLFLLLKSDRLQNTDAELVDVVHTCGGLLGLEEAIGTVDFYPNGGLRPQPGCGLDLVGSCSHSRSYQYMVESAIEPTSFPAMECKSTGSAAIGDCDKQADGKMGLTLKFDPNGSGTYYLETADAFPFDLQTHRKVEEEQHGI